MLLFIVESFKEYITYVGHALTGVNYKTAPQKQIFGKTNYIASIVTDDAL